MPSSSASRSNPARRSTTAGLPPRITRSTGQLPIPMRSGYSSRTRRKTSARDDRQSFIASNAFFDPLDPQARRPPPSQRKFLGEKGVYEFERSGIRNAFAANKPYTRWSASFYRVPASPTETPPPTSFESPATLSRPWKRRSSLPRSPHGLRPMPRSPLRTLDAESVLRNGLSFYSATGLRPAMKSAKRSSTTCAAITR